MAKRWRFHLRRSTRRSKKVRTRSQQSEGELSRGRAQLDETSITWTRSFEKEPGPSLGFIDPNFDETRCRNVAMFIAHIVRLAQARSQSLVVVLQLGKHV